jgi:hypothetical protein
MPVFLWLLGLVTTVAGLLLVASGVGLHDGTFDSEVLTPGMIAVVGGLVLVGLGIAVRELRRIERALAVRPTPRPERPAEASAAEAPEALAPVPALLAAKVEPRVAADVTTAATPIVEDEALERLRAKFPGLAGRQSGPIVQDVDASPVSPAPARVEVEEAIAAEVRGAVSATARSANGGTRPIRLAPRPTAKAHPTGGSPARTNGSALNTFWPASPRRDDEAASLQTAAAVHSPLPVTVVDSETSPGNEPPPGDEPARLVPSGTQYAAAEPLTVLKSGVVEGMAYTLYSDGSIEAQLPQGTLRFGSIAALRDHIEGTAQ